MASALRLGLPFVPSYLGQAGDVQDMIHGVNYASAGAGIIFSSGSELVCLSFIPFFLYKLMSRELAIEYILQRNSKHSNL